MEKPFEATPASLTGTISLAQEEKTLEKVACYEAHLCRQLYKAMHELEALQARREGGAAPLARLDVDGLPQS